MKYYLSRYHISFAEVAMFHNSTLKSICLQQRNLQTPSRLVCRYAVRLSPGMCEDFNFEQFADAPVIKYCTGECSKTCAQLKLKKSSCYGHHYIFWGERQESAML